MARDPVCGMDVDPQTATHKTDYFCAPGGKKALEAEPQKYLDPSYKAHM